MGGNMEVTMRYTDQWKEGGGQTNSHNNLFWDAFLNSAHALKLRSAHTYMYMMYIKSFDSL